MSKFAYLDTEVRNAIRERDNWVCQYPRHWPRFPWNLEVSHFIRRGHHNTRWDLENCDLLCAACHKFLGVCRRAYQVWKRAQLGRVRYLELVARGNVIRRPSREEVLAGIGMRGAA